jgi:hypothetical protein
MRVHKELFERWNKYSVLLLKEHGYKPDDVKSKITAWNIANKLDIPKEAYKLGMNDNHIETALKRIFTIAWSK